VPVESDYLAQNVVEYTTKVVDKFPFLGDKRRNIQSARELCNGIRVPKIFVKEWVKDEVYFQPPLASAGNVLVIYDLMGNDGSGQFLFYDVTTGALKHTELACGMNDMITIGNLMIVTDNEGTLTTFDISDVMREGAEPVQLYQNTAATFKNI
jgi:hypothetical protein